MTGLTFSRIPSLYVISFSIISLGMKWYHFHDRINFIMTHSSHKKSSWGQFWGFPGELNYKMFFLMNYFSYFFPFWSYFLESQNCKAIVGVPSCLTLVNIPQSRGKGLSNKHTDISRVVNFRVKVAMLPFKLECSMQTCEIGTDQKVTFLWTPETWYTEYIWNLFFIAGTVGNSIKQKYRLSWCCYKIWYLRYWEGRYASNLYKVLIENWTSIKQTNKTRTLMVQQCFHAQCL